MLWEKSSNPKFLPPPITNSVLLGNPRYPCWVQLPYLTAQKTEGDL